jgi:glycosyltransferase involved in cell wall biosynthesis
LSIDITFSDCNDNDIDAMASAIELLLTNANLTTKISQSARIKIEKKYSSSSILKQWIELINASLN